MANVPAPPPKGSRRPSLPPPPKPDVAPSNLGKPSDEGHQTFANLNFKVTPAFHKRFAVEASLREMSQKDLLEACFAAYLEANGGTIEKPRADLF